MASMASSDVAGAAAAVPVTAGWPGAPAAATCSTFAPGKAMAMRAVASWSNVCTFSR